MSLFEIIFYKDVNNNSPIEDYIFNLNEKAQSSKSERIKLKKIIQYMALLEEHGVSIGEPYVKHIDGDIWELRPTADRIFFFHWKNGRLVLLHHFIKKTNKTPRKEIEQAMRKQKDFLTRSD